MNFRIAALTSVLFFLPYLDGSVVEAVDDSVVEKFLVECQIDEGETELLKLLSKDQSNDQLRFELGVLQFFQTVEHMGQSLYEFGPKRTFAMGLVPILRMPVPDNPAPKPVELVDVRRMLKRAIEDLNKTDETLSKIKSSDVKIPLHVFSIHLDFDNDGRKSNAEALQPILLRYLGRQRLAPGRRAAGNVDVGQTVIVFDRADVDWLRGYCCLIRAMCETALAYDQSDMWDVAAHRFFKRGIGKFDFLREEAQPERTWDTFEIADIIAAIHNSRFPLKQPHRLKQAHKYMLEAIGHSREMWKLINAETDNDREWIPNPKQSNPISDTRITQAMTDTWDEFLDEAESILKGEILVPFWRGKNPERGVNIHKVFYQPTDLDVVLWIQGTGVVPFLEMGECTSPETWREFQNVFRGDFFGFAVWFN